MSEETQKLNKESMITKEESMLKQEIKFIQEEFKSKITEHKKLKEELKNVKISFHNGLKDYTTEKNSTIQKEREIESLLSKISKMRKLMYLSINQTINKKFYTHLLEISNNKQKEKILLKIFNFIFNIYNYSKIYMISNDKNLSILDINDNTIDECSSIEELLVIIKNENEIRNILLYMYDIFHNLQEDNEELFENVKKSFLQLFNDTSAGEKMYPFDFLLDFIKNIFSIICYEKNVEDLKVILNNLIKEKNEKFIEIKNIESIIKTYNRNIKIISNYIKALKAFYYRIKEQNKNNSNQNSSEKINKDGLKDLIDDIEKFKKITLDYDKINSNFDVMTSLSFGTNYTLSEKSSIKSSNIDSKNNNDDINNESKSEINENENNNINKDLNKNFEEKKNNNENIIKTNNSEKNNNIVINKFQKKSVENKILIRNKNINNNNSFINKNKKQIGKKNISLVHNNNMANLTTTDINKSYVKKQLDRDKTFNKKNLNKKNNNISYDKDAKNKNLTNKKKFLNNKNNIPIKINAQKILNKEIKKRFNSNNIKGSTKNNNVSPKLKPVLNEKNKSQIFEIKNPKTNPKKLEPYINKKNQSKSFNTKNRPNNNNNNKNPKNTKNTTTTQNTINISIPQLDLIKKDNSKRAITLNNISCNPENSQNLHIAFDKITEKEFDNNKTNNNNNNKPIFLPTNVNINQNQRYDFQSKSRYNISKKIEQLKQKESEEYIEITMPNKETNMNENYFENNNFKDSICDEMITQNFGAANSLVRSTTNDYINRLGFKNNVLWSENLYKNKALKFKSNFKKLNIENHIDTFTCFTACT